MSNDDPYPQQVLINSGGGKSNDLFFDLSMMYSLCTSMAVNRILKSFDGYEYIKNSEDSIEKDKIKINNRIKIQYLNNDNTFSTFAINDMETPLFENEFINFKDENIPFTTKTYINHVMHSRNMKIEKDKNIFDKYMIALNIREFIWNILFNQHLVDLYQNEIEDVKKYKNIISHLIKPTITFESIVIKIKQCYPKNEKNKIMKKKKDNIKTYISKFAKSNVIGCVYRNDFEFYLDLTNSIIFGTKLNYFIKNDEI